MAKRIAPQTGTRSVSLPQLRKRKSRFIESLLVKHGVLVPQGGGNYALRLDERAEGVTPSGREIIRLIRRLMRQAKVK